MGKYVYIKCSQPFLASQLIMNMLLWEKKSEPKSNSVRNSKIP